MLKEYDFSDIDEKGRLYVTDDVSQYLALRQKGSCVVPCLHDGNREVSFPGARYAIEDPEEIDEEAMERIYRRLAGLPWNICETERCLIRETTEDDLDSFYKIYAEPSVTEYMEELYADRQEELAYIRDYREKVYAFYGYGMWTVIEKQSAEVIGRAGVSEREGYDLAELGFVIGVPWQRRGYACEVCRAILKLAAEELEMERVQAFVQPENTASAALCAKLGFIKKERAQLADGIWYDRYEKRLHFCEEKCQKHV